MVKKIAVVSLSSGIIGEKFAEHEIRIGQKRMEEYGVELCYMPHARKGLEYVSKHPEDRAKDFLEAMSDESIEMILCAIGGDDTYRLAPYLFENKELEKVAKQKIFLGFSDSTVNHFMLHKVGVKSFYGLAFFCDVCELDREMLPYSRKYLEELLKTGTIKEITPSKVWYEERTSFDESEVGKPRIEHENEGFCLLQGPEQFEGEILGGCIDTIYDMLTNHRYEDSVAICEKYELFPRKEEWKGKILLLETSEEQSSPEHFEEMLLEIKKKGVFDVINGILLGKPMDEKYQEEYHEIIKKVVDDHQIPILANINVGHATPRCIIPLGVPASVDAKAQKITFKQY